MTFNSKQAMANGYRLQVAQLGTPISQERYKELRDYADSRKIRISGFRNYVGDIEVIKSVIDDIIVISEDFPLILDERRGIVLELDFNMSEEDFATTDSGHVIRLNAFYFSDLERLQSEYKTRSNEGLFVSNTDWRAIARHETGHVVANLYHINPLDIAFEICNTLNRLELFERLGEELSLYSTAYEDGREIISECFSGHYSKADNCFSEQFVRKCFEITKKGRC